MTGVHCLQHVQRFGAAHLTNDDTVGAHTQGVDHQLANRDLPFAFDVGRSCFQTNDMGLLETQLGGVFDGQNAFTLRNEG